MLERILSWWSGKILVLVLLGFAATDFLITMPLLAADTSTHLPENSYAPPFLHGHQFAVTLVLLAAVFLRGLGEAIGIAVVLALCLSGFEAGVLVMPQVADGTGTAGERLARRGRQRPGHGLPGPPLPRQRLRYRL